MHSCVFFQFKCHRLKKGQAGTFYPFVFSDIMGLEPDLNGVLTEDIVKILQGHVKGGYTVSSLLYIFIMLVGMSSSRVESSRNQSCAAVPFTGLRSLSSQPLRNRTYSFIYFLYCTCYLISCMFKENLRVLSFSLIL